MQWDHAYVYVPPLGLCHVELKHLLSIREFLPFPEGFFVVPENSFPDQKDPLFIQNHNS
jgi:hypothetical protein